MEAVEFVDQIEKPGFVWHAKWWKHANTFHRHQKAQLIFVAEGFQYLHTPDKRFLLPANHAAWIPSELYHRTSASSEFVSLRTLYYDAQALTGFYTKLHLFSVPAVLKEMLLYTQKWSLNQEWDSAEQVFLQAILSELPDFKKSGAPLQLPLPKTPELLPVVDYIYRQLATPLQLRDFSTLYPFSLRTLERKFKEELGMTLAQYIQLARIMKGVELLTQGQHTIKEIAHRIGYASSESFSNQFVKLMGKRPSAFVKK